MASAPLGPPPDQERYNSAMVASVAEVLRDALALPAEARAGLIDVLLESLDAGI